MTKHKRYPFQTGADVQADPLAAVTYMRRIEGERDELLAALEYLASLHTMGNRAGSASMDATRLDPYIMHIRAAIAKVRGNTN
jgi:hypothetical protein